MKKRPFLLLEILIAFILVAVCALPLIKQPLKLYRLEVQALERMEKERLADWTFTEVKEKLLKNEIPWGQIPTKGDLLHFELPSASIEIPGYPPKEVKRSFILKGRGEKVGLQNETYRMIGVEISLDEEVYKFRLPIQNKSFLLNN